MKIEFKDYFVYMYLDLDNIPFYVGKGKDYRYYVGCHLGKACANKLLKNKIRKVGEDNVKIYFLYKNLTEEEAFKYERYYISVFGRRDLKEGTLCNLTDGGEGYGRRIVSKETRKRMSESSKGEKNPMYGKKMSEESRKKMSEAHKGHKFSIAHKIKIGKAHKGLPGARGERHGLARLTEKQVKEIRQKYVPYQITARMLAGKYGVSVSNIHSILYNMAWKHVD